MVKYASTSSTDFDHKSPVQILYVDLAQAKTNVSETHTKSNVAGHSDLILRDFDDNAPTATDRYANDELQLNEDSYIRTNDSWVSNLLSKDAASKFSYIINIDLRVGASVWNKDQVVIDTGCWPNGDASLLAKGAIAVYLDDSGNIIFGVRNPNSTTVTSVYTTAAGGSDISALYSLYISDVAGEAILYVNGSPGAVQSYSLASVTDFSTGFTIGATHGLGNANLTKKLDYANSTFALKSIRLSKYAGDISADGYAVSALTDQCIRKEKKMPTCYELDNMYIDAP